MSLPSKATRDNTVRIWKNLAELLKNGMFFGVNAGQVAEGINFIEANVVAMQGLETQEDAAAAPAPAPPDLKVVADEPPPVEPAPEAPPA